LHCEKAATSSRPTIASLRCYFLTHEQKSIFTAENGKSLFIPFFLVSSLFLLWGFCNGMIDVMDKHFQQELHLTLA